MQYTAYTVSTTKGSNTVTGSGTLWATVVNGRQNVLPGDSFKLKGDSVIYQVAAVTDNTHLSLSVPFAGSSASGVPYIIGRDFTPYFGLAEINPGDQDWVQHLTVNVIRKIDALLGAGTPGVVTYATNTARVTNGSATVTGNSTTFTGNVTVGDYFKVAGDLVNYQVATVNSNTQLTLSTPYQGTTSTSALYQCFQASHINGDNMVFTDTVTGTKYFLRFENGSLYRVEV